MAILIAAIIIASVFATLYGWVRWMRYSNDKAFAAMTDEQRFIYEDILQQIENPQPPLGPLAEAGDVALCPHCTTQLYRWTHRVEWTDCPDYPHDLEPVDPRLAPPRWGDPIASCPECGSGAWMRTLGWAAYTIGAG